jgi:YegS/Rv2252/BmrU family lipid kinase
VVVVNPRSGNGATGRRWRKLERRLRARLGALQIVTTRGPRDAVRIAAAAVRAGAERLVVAGGDGTASEVASGVIESGCADRVQLGILPLGTGRDLPRTLGTPTDVGRAIDALADGTTRQLDAIRVRYVDREGVPQSSYALNVVSFGLSGLTIERVESAPRALGGSFAFLVGAVSSIARHRAAHVTIHADGQLVCDETVVLAAAANGRYFGGGMKIAPDAAPDDGLLDLVILRELSRPRLIANLISLYRGTHLANPVVSVCRATRVDATPRGGESLPILLDVDGEGLGALPVSIEVVPKALTVFGVRP